MKNKKTLISAFFLYLLSTASSYATFSFLNTSPASQPDPVVSPEGRLAIDPGEPKTETCPLNGTLYTKTERDSWETRRPLAVMVENSVEARPHSGIIKADVVYEAVAEGGVTRFMPVFYCDAQANDVVIAPVRSVRTYFIDWASEYGETPLLGHVGGANCSADKLPDGTRGPCKSDKRVQAIEQLSQYGWRYRDGNDLDQFALGKKAYIFMPERLGHTVAKEHSAVTWTEKLWAVGKERGWTNLDPDGEEWSDNFRSWEFTDELSLEERGNLVSISHDFWDGYKQFDAHWDYNRQENVFTRSTGGEPHLDLESGQQLSVKNVVVQFTKELISVDELKHNLYITTGEGDALVFQNGQAIEAYWEKASRTARTIFYNKKGQEIKFVPGKIWISVVGNKTEVAY